jgi:uncharacterized membrane protein YphA (DoxX/SURF4 family)
MLGWIGLLARVVVGGVWIWAGAAKLPDPTSSVRAVRAYQLLPETVVPTVGHALPVVEVILGACLVLGVLVRACGVVSALLLLAYIGGIASVWARGLQIDCGCFGGGGYRANATAAYPWEIARDTGLFLASCLLVWLRRTPWAVDNLLLGPIPSSSRTLSSKEA